MPSILSLTVGEQYSTEPIMVRTVIMVGIDRCYWLRIDGVNSSDRDLIKEQPL